MKLGLLGYPINHSLSPAIYRQLLGPKLSSYELFSFEKSEEIPTLENFARDLDGLNITSPYKRHFFSKVIIESPLVQAFGAINTIGFANGKFFATNTDLLAVREILQTFIEQYGPLHVILLGDGVMATLTKLVCQEKNILVTQISRRLLGPIEHSDLSTFKKPQHQTVIINSCSREFIFQGKTNGDEIFWDYNYSFLPHQNTLPSRVKTYIDGQEMLLLQAKEAIKFWFQYNSKLK